jgi:hypothetical protein
MLGHFVIHVDMSGLKKIDKPYNTNWYVRFENKIKQKLGADNVEIMDADFWDETDEEMEIEWYE